MVDRYRVWLGTGLLAGGMSAAMLTSAGVAAADEVTRKHARALLANTRVGDINAHPLLDDKLFRLLRQSLDQQARSISADMTMAELQQWFARSCPSSWPAV